MPLHGAIVCDLQYLYAILALYMLEIFTFFDVLLYCVPLRLSFFADAFTLGELTTFNHIRPVSHNSVFKE